jgi:hypothetical protein
MRQLLLLGIRLYRRFLPSRRTGQCLFKESCSRHVERIAREQGFRAGICAFVRRLRQCRRGYLIVSALDAGSIELILRDGTILRSDDISPKVFRPPLAMAAHLEARLNRQSMDVQAQAYTR